MVGIECTHIVSCAITGMTEGVLTDAAIVLSKSSDALTDFRSLQHAGLKPF
jgi:hypothetical protein